MITGDYHHTAVAVARDVGMVKPDGQVVVIDSAHREVLHQHQSAAQTPDAGNSVVGSPAPTPQVSFRQRNADFAHGFFAQSSKPGLGVSVSEAHPLSRASIEAAKRSRLSFEAARPSRVSFEGLPPGRMSLEGQQPSRMSIEGKDRRDLPFKAPATRLPAEAVFANWMPSEAAPALAFPQVELSFDNLPLTHNDAVHGKAPFEAAHQETQAPRGSAHQSSLSKRQPVKASSLIRLPSETAASMTASPPESSCISASSSRPTSQALLHVSQCLIQGSISRMIRPFRHTWDSSPVVEICSFDEFALKGLSFTSGTGRHHVMEPSEAFKSMTEGSMQCAVTGDALEYMLRMHDVSLLEAVMRNAVVFSRMQPHQKGQVMNLLGTKGIHQQFQGQPRHILVGEPVVWFQQFFCQGLAACSCCAVLSWVLLCCVVLRSIVLCCAVLCCAVLCCAVLCCAVPSMLQHSLPDLACQADNLCVCVVLFRAGSCCVVLCSPELVAACIA